MADIFDSYRLAEAWDEMFAAPGKPRPSHERIFSVLQPMDPAELRFRADQARPIPVPRKLDPVSVS